MLPQSQLRWAYVAQGLDFRARDLCATCARSRALYLPVCPVCTGEQRLAFRC